MGEIAKLIGYCFVGPALLALVLGGKWRSWKAWLFVLGATSALTATILAVGLLPPLLPKSAFLDALEWNWVGKVFSIAATVVIFFALPRALKEEAGLFAAPKPPEWLSVIGVAAAVLVMFWGYAWLVRDPSAQLPSTEALLYQASLPGLDEEASFRGVILALLIGAFGKPLTVAGIRLGWGALPVIAFFGLAHGFSATAAGAAIQWDVVAITGLTGCGLLWLKERTGSIWISVIVHNLANLGSTLVG